MAGGNVTVNNNLTLGSFSGSFGSAQGTLNINGGTLSVAGDIVNGGSTATIRVNGGTLALADVAGTPAAPVTTLALTNSTLDLIAALSPTNIAVSTLNLGGSANTISITSAPTNTGTTTFPLISYVTLNGPVNFTPDFTALSNAYPGLIFTGAVNTNNNIVSLSLTVSIPVNHPPVAGDDSFSRGAGISMKIAIATLLANDTDADLDTIQFDGTSATTTNGASLTNDGTYIYVPAATVDDAFTYTIQDGHGGTNTGNVFISIGGGMGQQTTITPTPSNATALFFGVPGLSYTVQRATNVTFTGGISNFPSITAPSNGAFSITDDFSDLGAAPPSAFYRLFTP
jgi:hypothetical protein